MMLQALRGKIVYFWIFLCALLLSACATPSQLHIETDEQSACMALFQQLDRAIQRESVRDAQYARVHALPFLRSNRFLASFSDQTMTDKQFTTWLRRMNDLAMEAYGLEWKRLSDTAHRTMHIDFSNGSMPQALQHCSKVLLEAMPVKQDDVKGRITVDDDYQLWKRVLGVYPLSAWAFLYGIDDWHKQVKQVFAQDLDSLAVQGKLRRYMPLHDDGSAHMGKWRTDSLGIPVLPEQDKQQLFRKFAPILEVDTVSHDDDIGRVRRQDDGIKIDVNDAIVYQYLSYTRFYGQILPQLNYIFWFPARPKTSTVDLLAGHVDSLIWRITLAQDGSPLLYDSIHSCGCYHMFFPTQKLVYIAQDKVLDEGALVAQIAPPLHDGKRMAIRIEQGSHYIQRLFLLDADSVDRTYKLVDYNILRALPDKTGAFYSVFDERGIMPSTDRLEAYFFWPMGIAQPGSMRQWGHHATAFVGHRHFDDAQLLQRYFKWKESR